MNGKIKGGNYERHLSKILSLWWTNGERDDVLWLTSNSGGRATFRNNRGKKTTTHCGDICAIDPIAEPLIRFAVIEAKKGYNKSTLHDLLDKPRNAKLQIYEEWFEQAERARVSKGSRYWMLIHCRDRREDLIFFPALLAANLILPSFANQVILNWNWTKIIGCRLNDFLQETEPSDFQILIKD